MAESASRLPRTVEAEGAVVALRARCRSVPDASVGLVPCTISVGLVPCTIALPSHAVVRPICVFQGRFQTTLINDELRVCA